MNERSENNTKTLLIGGNLICGTMHSRKLLSGITVAGALLGNSPFSLACTNPRRVGSAATEARRIDLENDLEAFLQQNPADFLVVDLHYVCQPLVTCDGSFFTRFPGTKLADYGKDASPISLKEMSREMKQHLIENYADMLLKYFPGQNIALLKTVKSEFYAVKNRVRMQDTATNKLFEECETWFQERTGCTVVDTLKFYFMEKTAGGMRYENEAYCDLADNVKRFVRRQHVRRRPIFRYSMDRYCRYYDNLYKRAFGAFLRVNNAVENLVYSSEPWFVKENYELLREAEKLLLPGYTDVANALDMSMKNAPVVRDILLAMGAAAKKDFVNPNIRYDLLFENRITVRVMWQEVQKYARANWSDIFPEQVTEVNYGYYFARMQMELTHNKTVRARAEQIMEAMRADETVILTPYVLDVWGSCVSRLNIQYDMVARRGSLVFRGNLFQAFPLFLDGPEVRYDKKLFAPPISSDDRVVQLQLDSKLRETLNETNTGWLLLDLYTLTAKSLFEYQGKVYCDNKNFCSRKMGSKNITLHKRFSEAEILEQLDRLADYLKSRYGDRVILVKHRRWEHFLDFQGKINRFPDKDYQDNAERKPYNDLYNDYLAERCGCYYIDLVDQFLADEMNILYLNSGHFENEFYEEVQKLMRYIMEEKPERKHFTTYDNRTRVKRIARLSGANPGHPLLHSLFHDSWLDDCLLKLPADVVAEHAEVFARLYDEQYPSAEEAIRNFQCVGSEPAVAALSGLMGQ